MARYTPNQAGRAAYLWWENLAGGMQDKLKLFASRLDKEHGLEINPEKRISQLSVQLFQEIDKDKKVAHIEIAEELIKDMTAERVQEWLTRCSEEFQGIALEDAAKAVGLDPQAGISDRQSEALHQLMIRQGIAVVHQLGLADKPLEGNFSAPFLDEIRKLKPDDMKKAMADQGTAVGWYRRVHGGRDVGQTRG